MRRAVMTFKSPVTARLKISAERMPRGLRNGGRWQTSRSQSSAAAVADVSGHPLDASINHSLLFGQRNKSTRLPTEHLPQPTVKRAGIAEKLARDPQAQKSKKRKRHGDTANNLPRSQRLRRSSQPLDYDIEAIERKANIPSQETLPGMPKALLDNPKGFLYNCLRHIAKIELSHPISGKGYSRCVVTCTFKHQKGLRIDAIGDGVTQKLADRAAFLHLVAKLNDAGYLPEILGLVKELDQETFAEEKDATIDVYNYAARYGLIPKVSYTETRNLAGRLLHEVTVEIAELGIKATKSSRQRAHAEVGAMILFKKEAQNYQSAKGLGSMIVNDLNSLTTSNARQFFQYYKILKGNVNAEVESYTAKPNVHQAQIKLGGEPIGIPVQMNSKKKAEDLAYLIAAVTLVKEDSTLLPGFLKALRVGNGQILRPLGPATMHVDTSTLEKMEEALRLARSAGFSDGGKSLEPEEEIVREDRVRKPPSEAQKQKRSEELCNAFLKYQTREDIEELRNKRAELPMTQYSDRVLEMIKENTFSIIIGATGSGKTTQVPQIILDEAIQDGKGGFCKVICTQPRRIAAISVAKRVAEERAESLQNSVGYHVRGNNKLPQMAGSITYCTTGILLQQLQHSPDAILDNVSHLVIDEVHERDLFIDFLLVVLKKAMTRRMAAGHNVPKVILMSATMDSNLFANYFVSKKGSEDVTCPTLSVPGRTFPLKELYLDEIMNDLKSKHNEEQLKLLKHDSDTKDYLQLETTFSGNNPLAEGRNTNSEMESVIDWKRTAKLSVEGETSASDETEDALIPIGLVAITVAHIAKTTAEGAVLVFLPGMDEISKVNDLLRERRILGVDFTDDTKYKIYMLHSSIQGDQQTVFETVPQGCRKIILGTNIAETSITIPDVQHVVDSGKLREKRYDQLRRITKLQCTWISKSNSKQRAGRAGRVQNGHYWALFSRARFESLRAIGLPELLRSDLQETCLQVKAQAFEAPIREFLGDAIEPPPPTAVDLAVNNLVDLDALTEEEKITSLGRLLATLPVHPSLGKMIVLGIIFRCLDPMIILGALSAERSLFVAPPDARRDAAMAKLQLALSSNSDHIASLNAFTQLRELQGEQDLRRFQTFLFRNFVHPGAFKRIKATAAEIEDILANAGLVARSHDGSAFGEEYHNTNAGNLQIVKALITAGLRPNIAISTGEMTHRTLGEQNCLLHPSSVNAPSKNKAGGSNSPSDSRSIYAYSTLAKSNDGRSTFLRDTTQITPLMAALFGGNLSSPDNNKRVVTVDGWLPFFVKSEAWNSAETIKKFRKALELVQLEAFRDLSKRQNLSGDRVREIFADALQAILRERGARSRTGAERGQALDAWTRGIDHYEPKPRRKRPKQGEF